MHRIGHVDGLEDEEGDVEQELRREDRPQQRVAEDEGGALFQIVQRVARRQLRPGRLAQAGEQQHGERGQRRGNSEGGRRAGPADQRAGERRPGGEGDCARQLDPRIGSRQRRARHQRRHQRRRGDAVSDRAGRADEAEERQQRQVQQAKRGEHEDGRERRRAQRLRGDHEPAARQAVGEQAGGDREQQERQRLRRLQQAGRAGAGAQRQHGDERRRGQGDLLGRLRRQVGPGQALEGGGKADRRVRHDAEPDLRGWAQA